MRHAVLVFLAMLATFSLGAEPSPVFAPGEGQPLVVAEAPGTGTPLYGTGSVDRVVILCSTADTPAADITLPTDELRRTIANLKPGQHFGLLFFHDDQVDGQNKNNELLVASPENKAIANKAIAAAKLGGSNIGKAAIEAAFKCKPQLIVLISSAALKDQDVVLKEIAELNRDKAVRINTVGYYARTTENSDSLKKIAEAAGGTYAEEPSLLGFGTPAHGGIGPKGPVFGLGGIVRRMVFVCNLNVQPMPNASYPVKDELNKAVVGLRPIQSFNAIFAGADKPIAFDKEGDLAVATPENKRKFGTFVDQDVTISLQTNPIPAIELAFASHPQLIYLLTDSEFADDDALLKKVRELNKDHHVKINTVVLTAKGAKELRSAAVLKTIASESNGMLNVVNVDDL